MDENQQAYHLDNPVAYISYNVGKVVPYFPFLQMTFHTYLSDPVYIFLVSEGNTGKEWHKNVPFQLKHLRTHMGTLKKVLIANGASHGMTPFRGCADFNWIALILPGLRQRCQPRVYMDFVCQLVFLFQK